MFKKLFAYIRSWFVKPKPLIAEPIVEPVTNLITHTCDPSDLLREAYRYGTDLAFDFVEAYCKDGIGYINCFRAMPRSSYAPDLSIDMLGVPIDREPVSDVRVAEHLNGREKIDVSKMPPDQAWHFLERMKPGMKRYLADKEEQRTKAIQYAEALLNEAKEKVAERTAENDKALAIAQANSGKAKWNDYKTKISK